MNIIETMRDILQRFPKISEMLGTVHVDFTDTTPDSYGLSPIGDSLLSEDILGTQTRQHSFLLYAVFSAINDYERLANSGILLELSLWLQQQIGCEVVTEIDGTEYRGELTKITTDNGMLYNIPEETFVSGVQYQLQINAEYTIEF
ncbi:MAG: hypothetical protein IJC75_01400 [Oscillospiraceae bacterium]|nr:hypothetical protein [Oscillospiraceae bacterium]